MGEPVDTSAEAVGRLYTGNHAASMEHRAFSTKGLREKLSYTVNPKDWVSAADYDHLQSTLTAAQQRIADLEAQCARVQRGADRYQFLRDSPERVDMISREAFAAYMSGADKTGFECFDDAIDAAMAEKEAG